MATTASSVPRLERWLVWRAVFLTVVVAVTLLIPRVGFATTDAEPNDQWWQASGPVGQGETVNGALTAGEDVDWYYFYLESTSTVGITYNDSGNEDLALLAYDYGALCAIDDMPYTASTMQHQLDPGLYYVEIKSMGYAAPYNFTLSGSGVTTTCPPGVHHHGIVQAWPETYQTSWSTASGPLVGGVTNLGGLDSGEDVDWYYFFVRARSTVAIGFNNQGNEDLALFHKVAVGPVAVDDLPYTGTKMVHQLDAGQYLIEVSSMGYPALYDFTVAGTEVSTTPPAVTYSTRLLLSGKSSVRLGHTYNLSGAIRPSTAPGDVAVTFTHLVGRRWEKAGFKRVVLSAGSFSDLFKPRHRGSWKATVVYDKRKTPTATYRACSATKRFEVH
jgi:hypothetical protein